ncbi:MAG: monovalent cation/H(+) antiporter subunit G [Dehalococcoidia bacterium]
MTTAVEGLTSALVLAGVLFMLLGAIGLLRFPNVYTRLHGMGLASTLGIGLVLLGSAVFFFHLSVALGIKALITLFFVLVTFPVGTHVIAWAAYRTGVPLFEGKAINEMAELEGERQAQEPLETGADGEVDTPDG